MARTRRRGADPPRRGGVTGVDGKDVAPLREFPPHRGRTRPRRIPGPREQRQVARATTQARERAPVRR
ncbi:bS18 family ribosomal protein [Saccharopolyspora cebuensis]|uniref:Uncharacterized protein n=1 Tax=Saccharopolyspora cebuensis TaxID=418759 RepID=A0ABV4CB61_9PSEU